MKYLCLALAYLLLRIIYYIGEAATEGYTWKYATSWDHAGIYHAWRELVENMGTRLLLIIFLFWIYSWYGILHFLAVEFLGLIVYELKFRHVRYGSAFFKKDGSYKVTIPFLGRIKLFKYPNTAALGVLLFIAGALNLITIGLIEKFF